METAQILLPPDWCGATDQGNLPLHARVNMFAVHLLSFYFSKLQEDQIKKVTRCVFRSELNEKNIYLTVFYADSESVQGNN